MSPDGELSRFPLNIFSVTASTPAPIRISQLDSPRELAYLRNSPTPPATTGGDLMLVVGGVDFGKGTPAMTFPPLPGTAKEANAVIDIAVANGFRCDFLTRHSATRAAVLSRLSTASIAHLATHGMFSDTTATSAADAETARNPLLSSAIILSAPTPTDPQPDTLTAEELTGTDLHTCRLIVLSACETGLGTKETGQGVLGLRTALMAAGARTLVMSLWKVPDLPTTILMQQFYENLLHKHEPPAVALSNAQSYVRTVGDSAFARPVNWGAWVLVGEGLE
jgi:CHAT domain-containing protein